MKLSEFRQNIDVNRNYYDDSSESGKKIKDLEEGMHDCIKAGLVGPTTNGSQEKDMD